MPTLLGMLRSSLRFHARSHLGVVLGAAVGSAALVGAFLVGDSVRESLKERARERLGPIAYAMSTGDRLFGRAVKDRLYHVLKVQPDPRPAVGTYQVIEANEVGLPPNALLTTGGSNLFAVAIGETNRMLTIAPALQLPATVGRADGAARANAVRLWGVDEAFQKMGGPSAISQLGPEDVLLNEALAEHLQAKPGDTVLVRVRKPSALATDAPIAPKEGDAVAARLKVAGVVGGRELGSLRLTSGAGAIFNAFVPIASLQRRVEIGDKINTLLASSLDLRVYHRSAWSDWRSRLSKLPGNLGRFVDDAPREHRARMPDAETLEQLRRAFAVSVNLDDLDWQVRSVPSQDLVEWRTSRIFLDQAVTDAALKAPPSGFISDWSVTHRPYGVLTYLANLIRAGAHAAPYSMVTAVDPVRLAGLPADLGDDEICVNQWLADDLQVKVGDSVEVSYFLPESGADLREGTNRFRIRAILPMSGPTFDRTLMPEFPGLSKAETTRDWDPGFPLVHKIREKDDQYWKDHRGTPKAFVTLAAGQRLWANRFGGLTAVRFPYAKPADGSDTSWLRMGEVMKALQTLASGPVPRDPSGRAGGLPDQLGALALDQLGFRFDPIGTQAMRGATSGQDFGGLFIGFSFFLVIAALLLVALLFQFGLEQRLTEIGTLLAMGFRPSTVRRLWFGEGVVLAVIGSTVGIVGGWYYAKALIWALTNLWSDAIAKTSLGFHATPVSVLIGWFSAIAIASATIWLALRRQFRRPARDLLAGEIEGPRNSGRSRGWWVGTVAGLLALALVVFALRKQDQANAPVFFGAGSLFLIAGLAFTAGWLGQLRTRRGRFETWDLAVRGTARRRSRSLSTAALLACGTFLVASIGAFRMDAERDAWLRSSGTGGFALIGETALPVSRDPDTDAGLEAFGLGRGDVEGVAFLPFRVRPGDDASCLNLNRAQRPEILGVDPERLVSRGAFTFAQLAKGLSVTNGWQALSPDDPRSTEGSAVREFPAIGDAASIQWALGKKIGDALELTDERGRPFRLRLVGGTANSILQGKLVIAEEVFKELFPGESGYRFFLIDAPKARSTEVSATLGRAFQDVGMELTPAARRLAQFQAVQNTYLSTFQVLGGLGLLIGSAGLGVVVLRNVLERRGELALLNAVGFRQRNLARLVLAEHAALLGAGLGIGLASAALAILPSILSAPGDLPWRSLGLTVIGMLVLGLATTWWATRASMRGSLLSALRGE
ncbi:MAG: ABC transporter permease [Verrucomicrobiales bacterium]|nr:ABC transporter permease [Verrucomicrobiales bacterium]